MEIGTAEIIDEVEEPKRRDPSLTSGMSPGGGRPNDGGGGGDDDGPEDDEADDRDTFTAKKYKVLAWFVLLVVLMTFGGLIAAYVVIFTNNVAEWKPTAIPKQLWFSTFVIIVSSVSYYFAERATAADLQAKAKNWFIATTVLGVVFVVSQVLAWFELTQRGLYMKANPYLAFFYVLTVVHALHVLGGIAALSTVLVRSWYKTANEARIEHRKSLAQVVGWYWHFLAILWIVLFVLLGFWK